MHSIILGVMFVFLVVSAIKVFRKKDFLHPLMIYIGPFFLQYLVFFLFHDKYSSVSTETLILYILSITMYILGYLLSESFFSVTIKSRSYTKLPLRSENYTIYRIITIVGLLSIVYEVIKYGLGTGAANLYDAMANHIDWGGGYNALAQYIPFFYGVVFAFFVYNFDFDYSSRKERKRFIWATIVAYGFALASFSRTSIMQQTVVLVYIVLYRNKDKIFRNISKIAKIMRRGLIGIAILIIIFSVIAKLTNKAGEGGFLSKDFFLWAYFSAQIRTLDKYVISHPGVSNFYYIGGVFSRLLGKSEDFRTFLPTINEFNVFSYIGAIYLDCGKFAYCFQAILGAFVAYIYNMSTKKRGYWTIFYAYYAYAIFMSFYAYQYSLTTYIYLLVAFVLISAINKITIQI